MHKKFQMSSLGELTFFLGLQVMQTDDRIFISQDKYVADILKKFDFSSVKTTSTLIKTNKALLKDEEAEDVDVHPYRSMIRSLMYLTASRPNIIDLPFNLEAFSDSDYAGASLDGKFTTRGYQFLRKRLISWQCKKQTAVANSTTKAEYVAAANCCGQFWQTATTRTLDNKEMEITATIYGKVKVITEASVRRHLKLEDSDAQETASSSHKTLYCSYPHLKLSSNMKRASKGYTGVNIPLFPTMIVQDLIVQGEGSTVPVESHHIPTGAPSTLQPHLSSPHRSFIRQETEVPQPSSPTHTHVADEAASTGVDVRHEGAATTVTSLDAGQGSGNIDNTPSMPYDLPLLRVNILRSDEGRMQHIELIDFVTKLSDKVLSLETNLRQTKKVYGAAYTKLIMKVKKLEKTVRTSQARRKAKIVVSDKEVDLEDPSKKGRREAHSQEDQPKDQLGVLSAAKVLSDTTRRNVQTYTRRRAFSSDSGGVSTASRMISTAEESVSTAGALMPISTAGMIDKGKGIMKVSELDVTKTKRKQEQERLGLETAVRLQEQFDKEEGQRMARVHEAAQTFTKEEYDNIKQRKGISIAKANRKKPMTQAQQRTYMSNYIKHMESYTLKQLKNLSSDEIKELFEETMRSIKDFIPMESEDDKAVPKDDLVQLWSLVKEIFSLTEPTDDKERVLWVKLKRLFGPDDNDEL
nr:ribonuclease H-like domain, reverse transcriptase, RNA-dependent DNA polymerase [Tanacetum cinerariifolium]